VTDARLVRITVRRAARHRRHSLALALMARARRAGLAGATMVEVVGGFGVHHRTHTAGRWALSDAVAYEILIVDTEERLRPFLAEARSDIGERGLVVVETVQVAGGRMGRAQR
jgi:PII-like signaling protein